VLLFVVLPLPMKTLVSTSPVHHRGRWCCFGPLAETVNLAEEMHYREIDGPMHAVPVSGWVSSIFRVEVDPIPESCLPACWEPGAGGWGLGGVRVAGCKLHIRGSRKSLKAAFHGWFRVAQQSVQGSVPGAGSWELPSAAAWWLQRSIVCHHCTLCTLCTLSLVSPSRLYAWYMFMYCMDPRSVR